MISRYVEAKHQGGDVKCAYKGRPKPQLRLINLEI